MTAKPAPSTTPHQDAAAEADAIDDALYREMFEHGLDGALITKPDGTVLRANAAACAAFGLSEAELCRRGRADRVVEDARLRALLAEREWTGAASGELTFRRADGSEFPVEVASSVIRTRGGERYTYLLFRDVTAQHRARQALRESEEKLRLLAQAMPQIVCVLGPDGTPEYVNPSWTAFSGLDLAATIATGWKGFVHPDDLAAANENRRRALKTFAPNDVELRYRAADGSWRWFMSRLAPVVEGGRVVRLVGAAMDIDARKRGEEALREADRRKNEFLGMLSHELRNPLAPIRNALYILDRADPAGAQARRAREVASRQVAHLTRLVDDLLDVTRIARGKIELRRAGLDLAALARRTVEDHRALLQQRGLALDVEVPAEPVAVNGDETRLSQVLGNLLSNAAKFTPAGGRVALEVAADGPSAVVRVRDTGPGIDRGMLEAIFDPFTQAKQTIARSDGGLGLGLALVRGLVALHGGEVRAASDGAGRGAEFVVRLPLAPPARAEGDGAVPVARAGAPRRRRVLVVDDNRDAADTLAQLVEMLGHDALVAYDGASALAVARSAAPEVVLCDIGLPGLDGHAVARALRASGLPARLYAVSGYAQPEDVARALDAGFDGHVAKPPDAARIEALLR